MKPKDKIKTFPQKPGVYLFKDAKGNVIYVGKAGNLKSRVKSYFVEGRDERPQIKFLTKRARDIDFVITGTEKEALLLENTLIKEHEPRYNFFLRDDKSYISICITKGHEYPGIFLTRRIRKDGSEYFGPYNSSAAAREALNNITHHFKLRTCSDREFANRVRPCLKYDIGRCTGPCVKKVSKEEYDHQVKEAHMFLAGASRELLNIIEAKMNIASEKMRYEEASRFRDTVAMLKGLIEKQSVVKHHGRDADAVGISKDGEKIAICLLKVRAGALIEKKIFFQGDVLLEEAKVMEEFLLQNYKEAPDIPNTIILSHKVESPKTVQEIFADKKGQQVKILVPQKGELKNLVSLAVTNAHEAILQKKALTMGDAILERLKVKLNLGAPPVQIECLDISNLFGSDAVGSVVTYSNGAFDKGAYRIYNIRTLNTPDDYAMMNEVLTRRFMPAPSSHGRDDYKLTRKLPDLLLVDGGVGQLNIALRVINDARLNLPVAAIAKGEKKGHADQIFIAGRKNPLDFKRGSKELLLLMKIRDEAHRFGINAHRKRRSKRALS